MKKPNNLLSIALGFVATTGTFIFVAPAQAAFMSFTNNRVNWENSVGTPTLIEDFSGFAQDTEFRTQSVDINGMTVTGSTAFNTNVTNLIDVDPLQFGGTLSVNGTNHLFGEVQTQTIPEVELRIDFENVVTAWGADFATVFSDLQISVFDSQDSFLGLINIPGSESTGNFPNFSFGGFKLDGGDKASYLTFSSSVVDSANTVFAMDDVALVKSTPEPTAILGLLGVVGVASKLKRKQVLG